MEQQKRRAGRPPVAAKRIPMSTRYRPEFVEAVKAEAARGSNVSVELQVLGETGLAVRRLLGKAIEPMLEATRAFECTGAYHAAERGIGPDDWSKDPVCYQLAVTAAVTTLLAHDPTGLWDPSAWRAMLSQTIVEVLKKRRPDFGEQLARLYEPPDAGEAASEERPE
jgi:hypothetical protein